MHFHTRMYNYKDYTKMIVTVQSIEAFVNSRFMAQPEIRAPLLARRAQQLRAPGPDNLHANSCAERECEKSMHT